MRKVCVLALIALGVARLMGPAPAMGEPRDAGRGASSLPPTAEPLPLAPVQTPPAGGPGTGVTLEAFGGDCGSPAAPEALGDSCSIPESRLDYRVHGIGDLGEVGALLTALQAPAAAQTPAPAPKPDPWTFSLTGYLWFPTTSATITAGRLSTSFSVGPFQYGIPFGAMGHFTAMNGKWGFFGDLAYMNAFYPNLGPRSLDNVLATVWIGEYGVSYRLSGPATLDFADWGAVKEPPTIDAYVGGRTFAITEVLTINFPILGTQQATSSTTRTSPLVGLRTRWDLSNKWSLLVDGNVGGFGVDNTTFAWEAIVAFGYKTTVFSLPAALSIGARVVGMDLHGGNQVLQVNQTLYGPFVGLTVFW